VSGLGGALPNAVGMRRLDAAVGAALTVALAGLIDPTAGAAAGSQFSNPSTPAAISIHAEHTDGRPLARAVTGEHWSVLGEADTVPSHSTAEISVARRGVVVQQRTALVRRSRSGAGRFRLPERFTHPGALTLVATVRAPDGEVVGRSRSLRLGVHDEGRRRAGCRAAGMIKSAGPAAAPHFSDGVRARRDMLLQPGARVTVRRAGRLALVRGRTRFVARGATLALTCTTMRLVRGTTRVETPHHGGSHVRLAVGRTETRALLRATTLVATRGPATQLAFRQGGGRVMSLRFPRSRLQATDGDVVLADRYGLPRLNTWPFARSPDERRAVRRDRLPAFWNDGLACSVGCRPPGARIGWPLRPFHRQHPLRSGLNELRPANLHIGIDIQALDGTPVYAVQSGRASIAGVRTVDERVQVGDYLYWHVIPRVRGGQYVHAFRTVVGIVLHGAGHLHFSEVRGGTYLNPLRPRGRVLDPYHDRDRPVIGTVRRARASAAFVDVFDPQTLRVTLGYRTPVLAPAAVAFRPRDGRHRSIGRLRFVYRGSQHLPDYARYLYGPGTHRPDNAAAHSPGWGCFASWTICVPRWNYRLGLLPAGTRQVSVYAWDWAGNVSVRTTAL
jgi:hypothetical protein